MRVKKNPTDFSHLPRSAKHTFPSPPLLFILTSNPSGLFVNLQGHITDFSIKSSHIHTHTQWVSRNCLQSVSAETYQPLDVFVLNRNFHVKISNKISVLPFDFDSTDLYGPTSYELVFIHILYFQYLLDLSS